jgi:hypothetical protein
MGGRGASSGRSTKGKAYGTEYSTVFQSGNIKFIRKNDNSSINTPMETMTNGRIYVTLGQNDKPKSITQYSNDGLRRKQIDITGKPHKINGKFVLPHTHEGYWHDEKGTHGLYDREKKLVANVKEIWKNRNR